MIIIARETGTGKRRSRVYAISATPQEIGSDRPHEVERFPTLESEALAQANKKGAADSLATTANP